MFCHHTANKIEYDLKILCRQFREQLSTFFIVSDAEGASPNARLKHRTELYGCNVQFSAQQTRKEGQNSGKEG